MKRALSPLRPALAALSRLWMARAPRERRLLALAAGVIAVALLWQVTVAPALQTWREAPAKQAALDSQTADMLQLQQQARGLQASPPLSRSAALAQLESSATQWLGPQSRISLQGDQVIITLNAVTAEGLSRWLALARSQVQALPVQAQLQQTTAAKTAAAVSANASAATGPAQATAVWSGTLVLSLR
jgi:general secretion pathway protein M